MRTFKNIIKIDNATEITKFMLMTKQDWILVKTLFFSYVQTIRKS